MKAHFKIAVSLIILKSLLFLSMNMQAQDIYFSQYNDSPLNLNPALTGYFEGNYRATVNYKNQKSNILRDDGLKVGSISYDMNLLLSKKEVSKKSILGLGITGVYDQAGELKYGSQQTMVSASFIKQLKKNQTIEHFLGLGLNLGITNRSIDLSNARWPSQYDSLGVFDPTRPGCNDKFIDDDLLHPDISGGMFWGARFSNRTFIKLGMAIHHFNRPNISFLGNNSENLNIRTTIHGDAEFDLFGLSILPSFMYLKQGTRNQILLGTSGRLYFDNMKLLRSCQLGFWIRNADQSTAGLTANAVSLSTRFDFNNLTLGLSYDFLSGLVDSKALEVSVSYLFSKEGSFNRGISSDE